MQCVIIRDRHDAVSFAILTILDFKSTHTRNRCPPWTSTIVRNCSEFNLSHKITINSINIIFCFFSFICMFYNLHCYSSPNPINVPNQLHNYMYIYTSWVCTFYSILLFFLPKKNKNLCKLSRCSLIFVFCVL